MKQLMKTLSMLLFTLLAANMTFAQVSAEYDKSVDFSNYKTFAFAPWQEGADKIMNTIDQSTLQNAITSQLAERGITQVTGDETPALYVTIYIVIKNETSTTAYTTFNGGLGMGYGVGWGYGMGSATTTYSNDDYQVGTSVLDFYDYNTKKLLWQGVCQGTIEENVGKRSKTIPRKVSEVMSKYPVQPVKNKKK